MTRVYLSTLTAYHWEVKVESFIEENVSRNNKCWEDPGLNSALASHSGVISSRVILSNILLNVVFKFKLIIIK